MEREKVEIERSVKTSISFPPEFGFIKWLGLACLRLARRPGHHVMFTACPRDLSNDGRISHKAEFFFEDLFKSTCIL